MVKSTFILSFATILSRISGFFRDILIANFFGSNLNTDIFLLAFRIPNLIRKLVSEGLFSYPITTYLIRFKNHTKRGLIANQVFFSFIMLGAILSIFGFIFSNQIAHLIGVGYTNIEISEISKLLNIMIFYILFALMVSFSMSYLNSYNVFFPAGISTFIFNIVLIVFIVYYQNFINIAYAVIIAGIIQFIFQLPWLRKYNFKVNFIFKLDNKIYEIIKKSIIGVLVASIYHLNMLIISLIATKLKAGSITYLYYSDRFIEITIGVVIASISNASIPSIAKNIKDDKMYNNLFEIMKIIFLFSIPASIGLLAIGKQIFSVFYLRGKFTYNDVELTYNTLKYAVFILPGYGIMRIILQLLTNFSDLFNCLKYLIIAILTTIISSYILIDYMDISGLILSVTFSIYIYDVFLYNELKKYIKIKKDFITNIKKEIMKFILSSILMFYILLGIQHYFKLTQYGIAGLINLVFLVIVGILSYFVILMIIFKDNYFVKLKSILINIQR